MIESEEKQGEAQREPRCDLKQLELLKKCSEKKDMTEWNNWREENTKEEIWLESADLERAHLKEAHLMRAHLEGVNLAYAHLEGANLSLAHLKRATVSYAHLERSWCSHAHLEGAFLNHAHLEGTWFSCAHLEGTQLVNAHLEGSRLLGAYIEGADLYGAHLKGAHLRDAHLEGADLFGAHIEGAIFQASVVDGSTLFWNCSLDHKTDFRGVGMESCRMDEKTKYLLEYNRRRMNCAEWYKQHPRLAWPVRAFFWMSDYGRYTSRIIFTFFGLALIFANIYYHWARLAPPGIVSNLLVDKNGVAIPWWLVPLRTIYFSIVTMTTLGFGDMFANSQSIWGHILLMLQVLLGYALLGALVTRFAVLFKSGLIPHQFKKTKNAPDTV